MTDRVLPRRDTLAAVFETLLPSDHPDWRARAVERAVAGLISFGDPDTLGALGWLLAALDQPAVMLLACGRASAFRGLTPVDRERALRWLATNRWRTVRGAFQMLKRIAVTAYLGDVDAAGCNPTWAQIGYPGPPSMPPSTPPVLPVLTLDRDAVLECDAVVAGAGIGGGVVADMLTAAGLDVVVLERGPATAPPARNEAAGFRSWYLDAGMTATRDRGVAILAGTGVGGGGRVNYTTSFRPPAQVLAEWDRVTGSDAFTGQRFAASLEAVCQAMAVNTRHNALSTRDQILTRGLTALSWHHDLMPRNVEGCDQGVQCGFCGFGCPLGAKQDALGAFLPRAAGRRLRIVPDAAVERVVVDRGSVVGLRARTGSGHVLQLRAPRVVLAAGAVNTPAILLRSGLRGAVGENLRLHPVTAVWGEMEQDVEPWTGTLQAAYSDELADLNGGYGAKLETAPVHPVAAASGLAWDGAAAFRRGVDQLRRTTVIAVLTRDLGSGRVSIGRSGRPVVDYRVDPRDQVHVRAGVVAAARVLLEAGARSVRSSHVVPTPLADGSPHAIERWSTSLDRIGFGTNECLYFSFHQLGSCAMGQDPRTSAVDLAGGVHGVRGLYVADGSLCPTATGVNPMVTIAALADYVARGVVDSL
ncbi:MAG: GMC family oxidoreductase [Chloroflexota bacterium]